MNINNNSPLVAEIKRAKSRPSSSTEEESDSRPSGNWIRIRNLIIRPDIQVIEIVNGQNAQGNPLRQLSVTFDAGVVARLTLADPSKVEQAIDSILDGFKDLSFFSQVVVE